MNRLGLIVAAIFCLAGCVASPALPDYATLTAVHQSQPFVGHGPTPIGDNERTDETNMDGIAAGVRWERGRFYTDVDMTYLLRSSNVAGNDWLFTFRTGVKFQIRGRP